MEREACYRSEAEMRSANATSWRRRVGIRVALLVLPVWFGVATARAAEPSPEATLWSSVSKGAEAQLQLYLAQYPEGQFARAARAALAALGGSTPPSPPSQASAPRAPVSSPSPRPQKLGWLVEVRAIHQAQQEMSGNPYVPWEIDPSPLALRPMSGPRFDVGSMARATRGAGRLPALGGAANWLVRQSGRWSIGARLACRQIGSATFVLRVQGNKLIDKTVGQIGIPTNAEETFSASVELEAGTYAVAWTLKAQPLYPAYALPGEDASVEILVGRPGEALAAPMAGDFTYEYGRGS